MGEILVYWIEKKLGLEFPFYQDPKKFRKAVSNGYLIGEILRKFNVISDDQCISLRKSLSNRNCVKNMQRLHKWIRDSGMDVDFQDLLAIVEEEPGAAMKFIYRLYLWLECPKCFTASGFQPLSSNLKKNLPMDLTRESIMRASIPSSEAQIIEIKPWEGLVERNKKFPLDADNVQFVLNDSRTNIYYDVPLQPPVLLNVKPFGGMGEDSPEDLYFDFRAVKPKRDERGFLQDWKREIPTMLCAYRISPDSLEERRQAVTEFMKEQEMQKSYEEMDNFSEAMKTHLDRPHMEFKVYTSGSGSKLDYQKTLEQMKQKRQEELGLEAERNNYRKNLTCKFQSSIPCNLNAAFESEILNRVTSTLPSREKSLAEFLTSVHCSKQCFIDHAIFEQKQLAEYRSLDLEKQQNIREQQSSLRSLLAARNQELRDSVTFQTLIVQEEVMYEKNRRIINEVITNLLDLVVKVATYREATGLCLDQSADILPPEPLMNEWIMAFHMADKAMEEHPVGEGQEMTILDNYHVDQYLFHSGDWAVEIPEGANSPFIENAVLKKIVSYVLETVYPPPVPETVLPPPEIIGTTVLAGVNYTWKPFFVRELLLDTVQPFRLQVLDATIIIQEAIKAYSTALAKLEESKQLALIRNSMYAYGEDEEEEEGEFQTLWRLQNRPGGDFTDEDEVTTLNPSDKKGRKVSDKEERTKKEKKRKNSDRSSVDGGGGRRKKSSSTTLTKTKSKKGLGKNKSQKHVTTVNNAIDETEEEEEGDEELQGSPQAGGKRNSDASSSDPAGGSSYDPNDISGRSVELALLKKKKKRRDSRRRSSAAADKDGTQSEWNNESSVTYEIVKDTLVEEPAKVDVGTEDEIQILFGPDDIPESWPEFVRLGKLALDQLLSGKPMTDDIIGKIIVERMRHYSNDSYVVVLNYPHALCQAITLENSVRPNNLEKPPCYHHADMLIHQFKHLRGAEGDAVLTMALSSPVNPMKHRSALFKYGPDTSSITTPQVPPDEQFRSFLDAVVIADVHASDKLKTQTVMNALEEAREKMLAAPDRSIEERINVLLHISFLQLKKFYIEMGLAQILDLGVENDVYYPAMRDFMETVLSGKKEHLQAEELMMKTIMRREMLGEVSEEEEEEEMEMSARFPSIPTAPVPLPLPAPPPSEARKQSDNGSVDEESSRRGKKGKKGKKEGKKSSKEGKNNKEEKVGEKQLQQQQQPEDKGSDKGSNSKKGSKKRSKASKDLTRPDDEEEDFMAMLIDLEEEEMSATALRDSLKPESFPSLNYNIEQENVAILANFWMTMEDRYLRGLRDALNQIRCHHDRLNKFMIEFRAQLSLFLNRPDRKQDLLTQFQEKFNQVNSYIRGDFEVKAELHNRVTELRDRLSAICDERQEEASEEMYSVLSEGYLEGETEILTNLFITFIQLEADHYCDVLQFVNDFYSMTGLGKPETIPWCDILRIELISRSRYSVSTTLFRPKSQQLVFDETDGEEGGGGVDGMMMDLNHIDPAQQQEKQHQQQKSISSSLQGQQSQLSWNISSGKSNNKKGKQTKGGVNKSGGGGGASGRQRRKSVSDKKMLRRLSKASPQPHNNNEGQGYYQEDEEEGQLELEEEEEEGGEEYYLGNKRDTTDPRIKGYFAEDEEDREIKIKKTYKQQILHNYQQSIDFLESVMRRVMGNVDKIESHTMNFLKTGTTVANNKKDETHPPASEPPHNKKADEHNSKSEHPHKKKKESKKKGTAGGGNNKDGSDTDSKANKKHKKKLSEVKDSEGKKSIQKDSLGNGNQSSGETVTSNVSYPKIPASLLEKPKEPAKGRGTKRLAEWTSAVEMEGIRVRQQLTLIHEKAKRELVHLKEMLLQVIMCAEKDAANTYKKEIDNVAVVCDIFRFAIENGTPVEARLTMEQDKFEIGSSSNYFRPPLDSSRGGDNESEIMSRPLSSTTAGGGYEADSNYYRSQSENEFNTTTTDNVD